MFSGGIGSLVLFIQIFFGIVIGCILNLLKNQQGSKVAVQKESKVELDKLQSMRSIKLTEPLTAKTRPTHLVKK